MVQVAFQGKVSEQWCNSCEKTVSKIERKYKGKKYCSTCYARIFKKHPCPSCGKLVRLPKHDDQAVCNECIKKQPCIRCNEVNRPVGKITEYGVVCNSCSVYFRAIGQCERCNAPSQRLTRISRFNDDLQVCPRCSTRDYETCPLCHKYRLLEHDETGARSCKKCRENAQRQCQGCTVPIPAGCGSLCHDCYWQKNLLSKINKNKNLFESLYLQEKYEQYAHWLEREVGAHKAGLYINKHTYFFISTERLWNHSLPTAKQLLAVLRASGLRKFELVVRWLNQVHCLKVESDKKYICSERDQMEKLISSLPQSSLAYEAVSAYKIKLEAKLRAGTTTVRSARLAIKPAVALMMHSSGKGEILPRLDDVKAYLSEYSGQSAALTGFINFLNEKFKAKIDYDSLRRTHFIRNKSKECLEKKLLEMLASGSTFDLIKWARCSLRYFHGMPYINSMKIKRNMINEIPDGFVVDYENKSFWIPKIKRDRSIV